VRRILALIALTALAACSGTAGSPPGSTTASNGNAGMAALAGLRGRPGIVKRRAGPLDKIGSSNTATADMPVPHPNTIPCVVPLFQNRQFTNFSNQPFTYTPSILCPGPWSKVILKVDVSVSKGIQFDRTAIVWLDGAPVYFGTTAEPDPKLGPSWSVQRDVTDLSALFAVRSYGQISLGNCYCLPTYSGIQTASAYAYLYPAEKGKPTPPVPDMVLGMPYQPPLGNATTLNSTAPMTISTTFPRNVERAYLDLYLQSQNAEEQWFMCVPTDVWTASQNELGFCQNGAFREGEVAIDGKPAGTSPIYPWIYTGGIDPDLWVPMPGVQTLQFTPYRVDLTPFASTLDDGMPHTISVQVANAYSYFTGTGDLLLYLDHGSATVTGSLVSDTIPATPPQTEVQHIKYGTGTGLFGAKTAAGPVDVTSNQNYTVEGFVNTSSGKIDTKIAVTAAFGNHQVFDYTSTGYSQLMGQLSMTHVVTTTSAGPIKGTRDETLHYPINVSYPISTTSTGFQLPIDVFQGYSDVLTVTGSAAFSSSLFNTVQSKDTMIFDKSFNWIGVANGSSSQLYTYKDSTGICYGKELQSTNNRLSKVTSPGCGATPPPPPPPPIAGAHR
jgi:Peptide N-acetyl-beta-D-glucosaminyl asparaginase amidase A